MAFGDVIARLAVHLGLNTAAFEEGATIAEKRLAQSQRKLQATARKMQGLGRKMSIGLTAPIAAIGAASVRAGAEFEKSMSNVSTLVDTNVESMAEMEKAVLGIATRTPVAIGDLTSALYDVRSAGTSAEDAMEVLERSAQLGVAGLGSSSEAVDLVTSSLNAFQLEGEKAEKVYDNIFRTVQAGKTTISELSQGFGAVAPVVAQNNIELDEYLASVGAMTSVGLPAAQAQTQIRAAIAGLTRETKDSKKVFSELGVKTFKELIDKSGGMVEAFQKIVEVTGGNEAQIIKLVGSVEGYNAIMSLTGQTNEKFTETLAGMRDGTDAVGEAFEKQAGTTAAQWQKTQNSLQVSAIKISTAMAPVIEKLAGLLEKLATWFASLDEGTQKWVVGIAALVAALGPVLSVVGSLLPIIVKLGPALSFVGKALLFIGANPIILGIAGVVAGIYLAWKNWDKITKFVRDVYQGVKTWLADKLGNMLSRLSGPIKAVTGFFKDMYVAVVGNSYVPDMVTEIGQHMARLDELMVDKAQKTTAKTKDAFRQMASDVNSLLNQLFPKAAILSQLGSDRSLIDKAEAQGLISPDVAMAARLAAARAADEALARYKSRFDAPVLQGAGESLVKPTENLDKLLKKITGVADKTQVQTVRIAKSFREMATETTNALQSMVNAIKGGSWIDILSSVVNVVLQLGSIGLFGKGIAKNINKTPGYAWGTNFHPGGLAVVGERGPELVSMPRGARVTPNNRLRGGNTYHIQGNLLTPEFWAMIQMGDAAAAQGGSEGAIRNISRRQNRRLG